MWTNCIVCSADLGRNEEVEHFPVGERLAFDPERGRLWALCPACERWNLTPMEVRWEALEELERLWEGATVRASTGEIGLARLRSGLEVVRIGPRPGRGELAVWRWGGRSGRRTSTLARAGYVLGAATVAGVGWMVPAFLPMAGAVAVPVALALWMQSEGIGCTLHVDEAGHVGLLRKRDLRNAGMVPRDDALGWSIQLQRPLVTGTVRQGDLTYDVTGYRWTEFTGDDAVSIARRAFPMLNRRHARDREVIDAIDLLTEGGDVDDYLSRAAAEKPRWVQFKHYPSPMRLAIEMALFQEEERRAMEGELERLREASRNAERIARISDALLPPRGWEALKRGVSGGRDTEGR